MIEDNDGGEDPEEGGSSMVVESDNTFESAIELKATDRQSQLVNNDDIQEMEQGRHS